MAFTKVAQDRPRVLIVGGGYVGFTVAKKIQKAIKETVTQPCRCVSTCATPS